MASKEKIYIPTYISSINYNPARVQPRIMFYNNTKNCDPYYMLSGSTSVLQQSFPYFDNYSGQYTTQQSLSLLFNNEVAPYGEIPSSSLYTTYWENYVNLLYNPRTRVMNCAAIIPLADYFQMELNDVVEFRGNYWHLRAINDYNLSTGECQLQLLGPLLEGTLNHEEFNPTPPAPPTPPPPPPPATQYTFQRYDVDAFCTKSSAVNVWSYTNYSDGFYNSGSFKNYISASVHTTYTTYFDGSATTCTPSTGSMIYKFFRYDVDTFCTKSNSTPVWSYNTYTDGFYTIDGNARYLETGSHTTFNQQITSATSTTCTPPPRYTYTRYDVNTQCSQSAATQVWSLYTYTENYYTQGATKYYIVPTSHTTYTTEFVASATSSCTPPPTEYYYLGKKYDCATCSEIANVVIYSTVNPVAGDYYSTDGTYSFKPQSIVAAQAYDVDITSFIYTQGATCAAACANY